MNMSLCGSMPMIGLGEYNFYFQNYRFSKTQFINFKEQVF